MNLPGTMYVGFSFSLAILLGLLMGSYQCIKLIGSFYGVELPSAVTYSSVPAPVFLIGMAIFAYARGRMIRMKREQYAAMDSDTVEAFNPESFILSSRLSWLERVSVPFFVLAFLTVPYWLTAPLPLAWTAGLCALIVLSIIRYGEKGRGLYY